MLLPATSAGLLLSCVGPAVTQVGVCGGLTRDGLRLSTRVVLTRAAEELPLPSGAPAV